MEQSTGQQIDKSLRRWHRSLSIIAWLLIIQSLIGVIMGFLGTMAFTIHSSPVFDSASMKVLEGLIEQTIFATKASIIINLVLLVGSIGLLLRQKWGWFIVMLAMIFVIFAGFIWIMPAIRQVLAVLQPDNAGFLSFIITALLAVVPAVFVVYLFSRRVISQFQAPG
ncbi:hypothetical protein CH330_01035 [candidate division WOR-3 bacterium JGI_Cruoil_03_51_56]|uniref:DUF2569 domain-containing protein n=1 Tax=candidate division WOR-3 bacterium JGI_Cruoil_03_51_56 TaxID=1973747 RepID=A0A235BY21_UNCW3|nr:MAG: hypothetical protein CH330_01035 [candidate division WOR-3 bacterium JGI_Cruoil_03_51_56]